MGKHERKRPLGTPGYRWENNIKMDIEEKRLEDVNWIYLAQDTNKLWAAVNTAMHLRFPQNSVNFLTT